jgi:hypothetical protein
MPNESGLKQITTPPDPIFILGITKRSGTAFLYDLLCNHPDCHMGGPIWENYLMEHAEMLSLYTRFTYNRWASSWRVGETFANRDVMCEHLGNGLISFLNQQMFRQHQSGVQGSEQLPRSSVTRLVTKSPSVENLDYFFKFLPRVRLLIIVRDGRAVTESSTKSFKRSTYEVSMREWEEGARTIIKFDRQMRGGPYQYRIIKYEDLNRNTKAEVVKILEFLDLDASRYPFEKIDDMPVRGSSEVVKNGELHWKPMKKSKNFKPAQRWSHWKNTTHDRFNWVAGKVQQQLGYDLAPVSRTPVSFCRNVVMDLFWKPAWPLRQRLRKLKYMLGIAIN